MSGISSRTRSSSVLLFTLWSKVVTYSTSTLGTPRMWMQNPLGQDCPSPQPKTLTQSFSSFRPNLFEGPCVNFCPLSAPGARLASMAGVIGCGVGELMSPNCPVGMVTMLVVVGGGSLAVPAALESFLGFFFSFVLHLIRQYKDYPLSWDFFL